MFAKHGCGDWVLPANDVEPWVETAWGLITDGEGAEARSKRAWQLAQSIEVAARDSVKRLSEAIREASGR